MEGVVCFMGDPNSAYKTGNGKSLCMLSELYRAYIEGKPVYTNMDINFPHKKIKSFFDILKDPECENAVIGVDEITSFFGSIYNQNKLPSDIKNDINLFINQHRKHHITLMYTVQHFHQVPALMRINTNILMTCYKLHPDQNNHIDPNNLKPYMCYTDKCRYRHVFLAKGVNVHGVVVAGFVIEDPSILYSKYDTYQIIEPIDYKKEKKERAKL